MRNRSCSWEEFLKFLSLFWSRTKVPSRKAFPWTSTLLLKWRKAFFSHFKFLTHFKMWTCYSFFFDTKPHSNVTTFFCSTFNSASFPFLLLLRLTSKSEISEQWFFSLMSSNQKKKELQAKKLLFLILLGELATKWRASIPKEQK